MWLRAGVVALLAAVVPARLSDKGLFVCPKGRWTLEGLNCYQFFDVKHSYEKASELCQRYGSSLVSVQSYSQNNFTAQLALDSLAARTDSATYWLGYKTYNDLQTNTLEADAGNQISQFYGHWALTQPDTSQGGCIRSEIRGGKQEWEVTTCEALLPFMCEIRACPAGSKHCSNGQCVNAQYLCDGQDDCGDGSDELDCEENCKFHQRNGGQIESPDFSNGRGKYPQFADCKWTLEGPQGTNLVLQFSHFDTEKIFDTVQILGGGRTEETATNIATLSGSLDIKDKTFTSASNFMIIKFRSDEVVEKSGFHASWTTSTDGQKCEGELSALSQPQVFVSPGYGRNSAYPGGLECLHIFKAPQGQIITLEIEDFDMEPEKDFVLVRDGDTATALQLAKLTGAQTDNKQFVRSTGDRLYVYTRTDQADSRRGYRMKYYSGCSSIITKLNGTLESPAYGVTEYPPNQNCVFRVLHPAGGRLSMRFNDLRLHPTDRIEIYDGENGLKLHEGDGFTGDNLPGYTLSAESGELNLRFITDSTKSSVGFSAVYSADCPALVPGTGAIASSLDTTFGAGVTFTCPAGQIFATGVREISVNCQPGGEWDNDYIPACQEVYCGPVPQIDNGFAVVASNVTYKGEAQYQCYAGFSFPSQNILETIQCLEDGSWSPLPNCQASKCPPLPTVEHASGNQLAGEGLNYGTVIRYECDPGYERSGLPTLLCQSNGTWSSVVPTCTRVRCFDFPEVENGIIEDKSKTYYFTDRASVRCHKGYRLIGTNIISCGEDQKFDNLPTCEDINECANPSCDLATTVCTNTEGSHYCKCKEGMEPIMECRPVIDLGLANGGLPDSSIYASGTEEGYSKNMLRLTSGLGWCGTSAQNGPTVAADPDVGNYVVVDLRAPTIIRGFRTQGVQRLDGRLAYPSAIRLMYADQLSDKFKELRNVDGSQVEFRVLDGASQSIMNLPNPIEARFVRLNIINFEAAPCMRVEINGCTRGACADIDECLENGGGCEHKCANTAGSFGCKCNFGYDLYTQNGTSEFYIPGIETGLRDGDTYRLNKTCVRKLCPILEAPENGMILTNQEHYRFLDTMDFMCNFGYVMEGNPSVFCSSNGNWNGTVPTCRRATCTSFQDDPVEGLEVDRPNQDELEVGFSENVTMTCNQIGRPQRRRATAAFRECVFDPRPDTPDYWLSGAAPECPRIDCGIPPLIPGADYGDFIDTSYQSTFFFGCKDEAFRLVGQSSKNNNIVTCMEDGVWDFGNLRCEGPVCEDPGRPADGRQQSDSYEQGSKVKFSCNKRGYIPINPVPIECVEQPVCKTVKPLGITSGKIPDSAINATSERGNYEGKNIRLNAVTGWCGQVESFTYVTVNLGSVHWITAIPVKGVITQDVVGRPTEIRIFYKESENDQFIVYPSQFNFTSRDPGNYGEMAMINLPKPFKAKEVIIGIVGFDNNPCLKFELMGCEDEPEERRHLGFNAGFPLCVDNEPPAFKNCPAQAIVVEKGANGFLLPVNFSVPFAVDNSGSIARTDVKPEGFTLPLTTFEEMQIQYFAYDYDGNVAICMVNITVPDDTPPNLKCPQSFVIELVDEKTEYPVDFKSLRSQVNASDPSGKVEITFKPEGALIKTGDFQNVTVFARDKHDNVATCHFQVTIQPTTCVAWELKPPAHGEINCTPRPDGYDCAATCNNGYRFTDGQQRLTYSCKNTEPKTDWSPSRVVPDCVSENTRESTYDVVATLKYQAQSAEIPTSCIDNYIEYVEQYYESLGQILTDRCSASGVPIDVNFKKTLVGDVRANNIDLIYTMMVDPSISQPRIYELCGQTHSLIFDLTLSSGNDIINNIVKVSGGDECPTLTAKRSEVSRGFACNVGEVLNKIVDELVPRCLECPAGFFAGRGETSCTQCPRGEYQDDARQGSCKRCPAGRWTKDEGSKSLDDCIPVCGHGTYSPTGLVPCLECESNSYSTEPPVDGYKVCDACPEGMYTFQPGANNPDMCRESCSPGYYSPTGLAPCAPCPSNHFQPLSRQRECFRCQSGTKTFSTGAASKDDCTDVDCKDDQCMHGGLCVPIFHRSKCYCPAGFSGKYCEVDVDECASQPCYNNATCVDLPQSYRCDCPAGFSGLQCQDEKSDCDEGACPDRAMCKDLPGPGNFECLCRTGYKGEQCDVTEDPCSENGNPCDNGAVCRTLPQGRFTCQCPEGWEGQKCEINIDDCLEQPCLLGGNCTDLVNDFQCKCPNGFGGKRCQEKIDLCEAEPCVRGMCVDKLYTYECICEPGWTGGDCDTNIDDCERNPCENNGICVDQVNGYSCACEAGYTGKNCQHTIDYCVDDPCKNGGTCKSNLDSFVCECRPGFSSTPTCDLENDECSTAPCDPSGTQACLDLDNRYECKCRDGYVGEFCQTNVDDCGSSPCRNGGSCEDLVGDYECLCPKGWNGKNCEMDEATCSESTCENNANCINLFQDFFCDCPSGTDGKKCETSPQRCIGEPCMNNGACKDLGFTLNCTCSKDYTGEGCQYEFDACAQGACKNGAECIDKGMGYKCICPPGYTGENCDENIDDCALGVCSPTAECIDLTNDFYCKCPFNLTGEDCRKQITTNYDLHFADESKSGSASLVVPFNLGTDEVSVAMWVQFDTVGETGTYFTLYSVSHEYYPVDRKILLQAQNSGVFINLFEDEESVFLQFPSYIQLNNGQWHHVAVTWSSISAIVTLTVDSVIADKKLDYGSAKVLAPYGYVTLGSLESDDGRKRTESGFHGKLSRVQIWNRALDTQLEIPRQVVSRCSKETQIIFPGLILRWAGYDKTVGGVERIMPSICGKLQCEPGFTGPDCNSLDVDKIKPEVLSCPGDIWVATNNGSAFVTWDEPRFSDNVNVSRMLRPSLSPGNALHWGTYDISYIAYDDADNSADCSFKVYVLQSFCPPLDPPEKGTQSCEDWGPGGRFKVCRIECDEGMKFSQTVPEFYTCGAEGFWRPSPNQDPTVPFVYPACSAAKPAQKIYTIKLQYLASVLCSKQGHGVLKDKIITALEELNKEWRFSTCDKISEADCAGLGVNIDCIKKDRVKRQSDDSEQAYDLEISFPTLDGDEAVTQDGRRAKIASLLESILLEDNQLSVDDTLPGTLLDPSSIFLTPSFSCPSGSVVVDSSCVPCPAGTYFAGSSCEKCPLGQYNSEAAQLRCTTCPEIGGGVGVTQTRGASSVNDCKMTCSAGHFYDDITGLCRPCGHGRYQPEAGRFSCMMCGVGLTTRTKQAMDMSECLEECGDGQQLDLQGACVNCPVGTFRRRGIQLACERCPPGFTTSKQGSVERSDCSLPICRKGTYLNATTNSCTPCARGNYQDEEQQTSCKQCPSDTSTKEEGATSSSSCTNRCKVEGGEELCDEKASCLFHPANNTHSCECTLGYVGSGKVGECVDSCDGLCRNEGECLKTKMGEPYCQCSGSFTGEMCEEKSEFAYISGGVAGAVLFVVLLVLLIWMICVRATRRPSQEKAGLGPGAEVAHSGVNFYYGSPAPYAESIAPSHHSTYAHYYDDEEDGWDMPNFYGETANIHKDPKMNSLARSQGGSVYGNKEELYDRLRRHAYNGNGKKDKRSSANETTSESDDGRN